MTKKKLKITLQGLGKLFDENGSIDLKPKGSLISDYPIFWLRVRFTSTKKNEIEKIREFIGTGKFIYFPARDEEWLMWFNDISNRDEFLEKYPHLEDGQAEYWILEIIKDDAEEILSKIKPYLDKKEKEAEMGIKYWKNKKNMIGKSKNEIEKEYAWRYEMYVRLSGLQTDWNIPPLISPKYIETLPIELKYKISEAVKKWHEI